MYAGIDLGGTTIKGALVNGEGKIVRSKSIPTGAERPKREIVKDMAALILDLAKEEGLSADDIERVGIGSPGTINPVTGTVVYSNNFKDFKDVPVRDIMHEILPASMPIHIDNDANVAALGECLFGAGRGCENTVMITIGTGLGGGIIIGGRIFSGSFFGGGELGHTVIVADGRPCTCGRKGCWETYSSATGMVKTAREKLIKYPDSAMAEKADTLNALDIRLAERAGDRAAIETLDEYVHYLAIGIINLINVFQPESIIIGGGPSADGDLLLNPLLEEIGKNVYGGACKTQIEVAELGNKAGVIGAAFLQ